MSTSLGREPSFDALAPHRRARRMASIGAVWWRVRASQAAWDGWPAADVLRARGELLRDVCASLCRAHEITIDADGPEPTRGSIIVANHTSYVDTLVLPSFTVGTCIAKRELGDWPLIGAATDGMGIVFVDRACAHSGAVALRRALRALDAGLSVIAFPEGTTTQGCGPLLPFKRGVFGLARRTGAPVVPAAITYDARDVAWFGDTSFLGHYLGVMTRRPQTRARVSFGHALDPARFSSARAMADDARQIITGMLDHRPKEIAPPHRAEQPSRRL